MAYKKIVELVKKLHDKTIKGKIQWEKILFEDGIYQAIFPGYTIKIRSTHKEGEPYVNIAIYDGSGELIEAFDDGDIAKETTDFVAFELMSNLLENARRIAMGSDQAIDKILSALGDDDDILF